MNNIRLRKWEKADVMNLVKYTNNPNVAKFLTDGFPHPYTQDDAARFINFYLKDMPAKVLAIEVDGEAVGSIGIFPQMDIYRKNAEMGYWLAEEYWGKGIMTGVIRRMVDYGFGNFDIDRIFARPFGTNKASQRVLEKNGFALEATFEKVLYKNGDCLDELVYAIRRK